MLQSPMIEIGLPIALFMIMAGLGLSLTRADFREVWLAPRASFWGLAVQVLLMPALALGIAALLGLRGEYAVGLVLIAACPGGPAANIFAYLVRADVALCVVITVLSSFLAFLTLPLFVEFALAVHLDIGRAVQVPVPRMMASLVLMIILPVLLGMWVRRRRPGLAARLEPVVGKAGFAVLILLVVAILFSTTEPVGTLLHRAGLPVALLLMAALLVSALGGLLLRLPARQTLAIVLQSLIKSGTLGLVVALSVLKSTPIAVPVAVYACLMFLAAFVVVSGVKALGRAGVSGATQRHQ